MVDVNAQYKKNRRRALLRLALLVAIIVLLNILLSGFFYRIDLTQEKRYSLSGPTKELLKQQNDIIYVKIYLAGNLTPNIKNLQQSTIELLNQFRNYAGNNIQYEIINPFDVGGEKNLGNYIKELEQQSVYSIPFSENEKEQATRSYLFPYATITYHDKAMSILLLNQVQALTPQYDPSIAISLLEYKFSKVIRLLITNQKQNIAFIEGQNELDTLHEADIAISLNELYNAFRLNLRQSDFIDTTYKVIVIAKPTAAFNDADKYKIDQYLMYGGSILWLIDPVIADFDSLKATGKFVSVDYDLNIMDQLIQYGVRINSNIIQDKQNTHIRVPFGNTFSERPWPYNPVITGFNKQSPLTKNVDAIEGKFMSSIDTMKVPGIKKTILLTTSASSRYLMSPANINYNIVDSRFAPADEQYNKPYLPVAVLLEGEFNSAFAARKPLAAEMMANRLGNGPFRQKGLYSKMIVIGDGDMIKNYVDENGKTYPLGANNIEKYIFGNKDFIMNCIEYLSDNTGLIETRAKEIKLRPVDEKSVSENRIQWQLINIAAPLVLLYIFSGIYNFIRTRKYTK